MSFIHISPIREFHNSGSRDPAAENLGYQVAMTSKLALSTHFPKTGCLDSSASPLPTGSVIKWRFQNCLL